MAETTGRWAGGKVLELKGPLDQRTVVALRHEVDAELIEKLGEPGTVTLDFSGVTRADSAALSLILHWMRLRRTRPATLALKAVPEQLRALARTSRMEQYLDG
jgi:phospholipid transport system transporter-binding protein